nr:unnamed protein product [Callosobruchus analis]
MGTIDNVAYLTTYSNVALSRGEKVLTVFLDLKAAFNKVNVYTLYKILIKLDVPLDLCNLILRLISNKPIYILNNNFSRQGPLIAYQGLRQGSPLSPILFNIYLSSIYNNIPPSHKLLGYADDLVLVSRGNNISDMVTKTNETLDQIYEWTKKHDLTLSKEKCKAMIISRGKHPLAPPIIINNRTINYIENYKYLGVSINQKLKWNQQINTMVNKANQGLNIIKTFCRTRWGADPKTMQIAVNAFVKSHLDYKSYWRNKNTPYLVCAYNIIEEFENYPKISQIPLLSDRILFAIAHNIKVINLNIKKNDSAARYKFLEYTDMYKNTHNFIYTDASKNKHRVGCAVHIPGKSISLTTRLPDHMNVYSAEMVAILHACNLIIAHNLPKSLIFTDSKSAIDKLINPHMNANKDCICLDTQLALREANSNGKETLLIWIPGHSSIQGNEVVDHLAKLAVNLNVPIEIKLNKSDILSIAKNNIKKKFKAERKEKSQTRNNWYSKIQTDFPDTPWHTKYPYINRRHVTTTIRMRTGHCGTNQHLYRIGMKDSPLCRCGEVHTDFKSSIFRMPNI